MIGQTLAHYRIVAKLGEGGMGEVFRATDTKLDREVAIKVLPPHLAADADALARFEREAKAVAALSHPNILAIFDFGKDGEIAFAAMELLEGETLRERLVAGALPPRKALEIAAQVATGLAAAHARGIVHRDLKPDNLFLTRDGQVKILDFGLARQSELHGSKSQLLAAPTQGPGTEPGAVLGTVGYMSPEQVRGETADHRSDLFALGVVLYEMLTGRAGLRARFGGRDDVGHSARRAVGDRDPRREVLAGARAASPALPREAPRRALSVGARSRLRSQVTGFRRVVDQPGRRRAPGTHRRRSRHPPAQAGCRGADSRRRPRRLAGRKPPAHARRWPPRLRPCAPTFRQLTQAARRRGQSQHRPRRRELRLRQTRRRRRRSLPAAVDGAKPIPLTADCAQDDTDPDFSPDGRTIAYRSECGGGGIFVMGATGESSRRVTDFGYAPAWSPDAPELAVVTEDTGPPTSRNSISELWAVRLDSGARRRVSHYDAMAPTWSPDGRRIAFWGLREETFQRDLWSVAADGSESAKEAAVSIVDDAAIDWAPVYSHDGRWLYFASTRGGTFNLWRLALDAASGEPQGEPEPLTAPSSWAGPFDLSADGRRIVFVDRNAQTEIVRAALDPARQELAAAPAPVFSGSFELREQQLSFDGKRVVFTNEDMPQHLHLVQADGTGYRQLTTGDEETARVPGRRKGTGSPSRPTRGNRAWPRFTPTAAPGSRSRSDAASPTRAGRPTARRC